MKEVESVFVNAAPRVVLFSILSVFLLSNCSSEHDLYAYQPGVSCTQNTFANERQERSCLEKAQLVEILDCNCGEQKAASAALTLSKRFRAAGYVEFYFLYLSLAAQSNEIAENNDLALRQYSEFFLNQSEYGYWRGKYSMMMANSIGAGDLYQKLNSPTDAERNYCFAYYIYKNRDQFAGEIFPPRSEQGLVKRNIDAEVCAQHFEAFDET